MTKTARTIGDKFETDVARMALDKGYQIVERNYSSRWGEIDLIISSDQTLIFVECKSRKSRRNGAAQSYVTTQKQQKIINTALLFLSKNAQYSQHSIRFDVVAKNNANVEWLEAAFYFE